MILENPVISKTLLTVSFMFASSRNYPREVSIFCVVMTTRSPAELM
jgi:hypothetical protein